MGSLEGMRIEPDKMLVDLRLQAWFEGRLRMDQSNSNVGW
jgi:hypothetical protein